MNSEKNGTFYIAWLQLMESTKLSRLPQDRGLTILIIKKTQCALLTVSNRKYEFTLIDIVQAGQQSDGDVYKNSNMGYAIN